MREIARAIEAETAGNKKSVIGVILDSLEISEDDESQEVMEKVLEKMNGEDVINHKDITDDLDQLSLFRLIQVASVRGVSSEGGRDTIIGRLVEVKEGRDEDDGDRMDICTEGDGNDDGDGDDVVVVTGK